MSKFKIVFSILMSLILVFSTAAYGAGSTSAVNNPSDYIEGVLLIQFERDLPEQAKADVRAAIGIDHDKILNASGLERVIVRGNRPLHSVIAQLKGMSGVVFAEPDFVVQAIPIDVNMIANGFVEPGNETHYNLLWGLNNTGQSVRSISGDGVTDIDAPAAWEMTAGSESVVVAVIDEAVDMTHPDLQGVVIDYQQFNTGGAVYEHGTHVAGTIAANDNAIGVVGVAPAVKIMSLSFLGANGGSTSNAILAINYAKNHGAHIINASWGGGGYSQALKDAIEGFGGPFIAAAGNSGVNTDNSPHYPSAYNSSNIVSVAAVSNTGGLASFSNYGATSVDIAGPGVDIVSTYPGGYAYMSGTSMAAPHVAGVVALMKSYKPTATTEELLQVLYGSGRPMATLSGKTVTGKLADADNALIALGTGGGDTTPPELLSTLPVDGSQNVPIDTLLKITFNEAVQLLGNSITVNDVTAAAQAVGNEILITPPVSPLDYSTNYVVVIEAGTVADTATLPNPFDSPISYQFKTVSAPVQQPILVVSSMPANNQTNVKRSANIVVTFDSVFTGLDPSKIRLLDASNNTVSYVTSGIGTSKLTINPNPTLSALAKYTVVLEQGAVYATNASLAAYTLTFTTGRK